MFTGLLVLVLLVVVIEMNGRLRRLQRRVEMMEHLPRAEAANAPEVPEPVPPVEEIQPEPPPAEAFVEEPLAEEVEAQPERARLSFEDIFGRKLPIWAGGVTLAIAGFLIVKYSIDIGLFSPAVRVVMGLIFGSVLIAGAEVARNQQARVRDPRVAQALAGAGAATLYGSVLIAGNVYGLIGQGTAFVGLAAVTALALGLALRFGAPSALLGLVGGFAAPLFVGSTEPSLPLLTAYLALTVGGLSVIARAQGWAWLGYAALAGGFLWSAWLIAISPDVVTTSLALGPYLLLLALAIPFLALTGQSRTRSALSAGMGALQVAALVAHNGFAPLDWVLFAMLSIGVQWLARREPALHPIRAVALAAALLLLAAWPTPLAGPFALALAAMLVIHGLPAVYDLWRAKGGMLEAWQIVGAALAVWLLPLLHFHGAESAEWPYALLALAGCAIAGGAAALGWRSDGRRTDLRFPLLVVAASLSAAGAAAIAAPLWLVAPLLAMIAGAVLVVALVGDDDRVEVVAWAEAALAVTALLVTPAHVPALVHAAGLGEGADWRSIFALLLTCGVAAGFAWRCRVKEAGDAAQVVAALLGYVALGQLVPIRFEAVLAAALLAGLSMLGKRALPGLLALAFVVLLWAAGPALLWARGALLSLAAVPLLVMALPPLQDVLLQLALPALGLAIAGYLARVQLRLLAIPGAMALVAGHIAYKHLFGIADAAAFEAFGLAERTLWEGLLIAGGAVLLRRGPGKVGLVLTGAGLAHFGWYSLLLHNPLWWPQQVGAVPLLNLLVPAYGLPLIALWLAGKAEPRLARAVEIARMVLILLLAWSLLRQAFHGSVLAGGAVSQVEDIARSLLLVAAAIGFLVWGIVRGGKDWRLASLALMLIAAAKVFLWDAAGLEGLLRIGSFIALGFSLIGIGWLYARFVNAAALTARS